MTAFIHFNENASYYICTLPSAPTSILRAHKNSQRTVKSARATNPFLNRIGMRLIYEPPIRTSSTEGVKFTSEVYSVALISIVPSFDKY